MRYPQTSIIILLPFLSWLTASGQTIMDLGPGFRVINASSYQCCTLFLNDEPIQWQNSPGITIIRGYPLKPGTNSFNCIMQFLQPRPNTNRFNTDFQAVMMSATLLEKGTWRDMEHWGQIGPFSGPTNWEFTFEEREPMDAEPTFDDLGQNRDELAKKSRTFAIKIAKMILDGDATNFAKVFGFQNIAELKAKSSGWFNQPIQIGVSPTGVTNESELLSVTGKRFVLIRCEPGKHLVSFRDKHDQGFALDSITFARRHGAWEMLGNNGQWLALDPVALNN